MFEVRPTSSAYPIHEDLSDDHWNKTRDLKNLYFFKYVYW